MHDEVIGRTLRAAERCGLAVGSPLQILALKEVLDLAGIALNRRETTQGVFDPNELAYRYCREAVHQLGKYEAALTRWEQLPRGERGPKPKKPSRTAIAIELSPDVVKSQACERLRIALHPLRMHALGGLKDPLHDL